MGEGLIIAKNSDAGIELMKLKYSMVDRAVIPSNNLAGLRFLQLNGFKQVATGKKMILGEGYKLEA